MVPDTTTLSAANSTSTWYENGKRFEFNFWTTKEGHDTTDDLPGHLVAAAIYFGLGASMLIVALKRARLLAAGESFADRCIPEPNPKVLQRIGTVLVRACSFGFFEHILVGMIHAVDPGPFHFLGHLVMYASFMLVGSTARLEAQQRLPPDSFRAVLAVALFTNGYMLQEHAVVKAMPQDAKLHEIWGQVSILNAAVLAFSVRYPRSVTAYVMGYALMVLTAMWLVTIGVWSCCWDVQTHMIGTYLGIEVLFLLWAVLRIVSCCLPPSEGGVQHVSEDMNNDVDYAPLSKVEEALPGPACDRKI